MTHALWVLIRPSSHGAPAVDCMEYLQWIAWSMEHLQRRFCCLITPDPYAAYQLPTQIVYRDTRNITHYRSGACVHVNTLHSIGTYARSRFCA
jgi:hypothetical protein